MSLDIGKETSRTDELRHGHTVVGATPVRLCGEFLTRRGILVRCPGASDPSENTSPVWIGRKNVTADSGPNGGLPILAGTGLFIPIDNPNDLYVVALQENQDIAWIGV
jgi:hypothetical protein